MALTDPTLTAVMAALEAAREWHRFTGGVVEFAALPPLPEIAARFERLEAIIEAAESVIEDADKSVFQSVDNLRDSLDSYYALPLPKPPPDAEAPPAGTYDPRIAPGHTDLMVSPESIDAFMEANPLPDAPAGTGEAG